MGRGFAIALGALRLGSCGDATTTAAEKSVRDTLKDPDSARFSDIRPCPADRGVTGDVNSKNSYGGYAGKEPFVYVDGRLYMGSDEADGFSIGVEKCYGKTIEQMSNDTIANAL